MEISEAVSWGRAGAHPMMLFVQYDIRHLLQFVLSRTECAEGTGKRLERNATSELRKGWEERMQTRKTLLFLY